MDKVLSNAIARDFLRRVEGCELEAYRDTADRLTIGVGHCGPEVHDGMKITQAEADALLEKDMAWACAVVNDAVKVPLNENQRAALCSFVFNIGAAAFRESTLLRVLNAGFYKTAEAEFARWNKITADGKKVVSPGLINRRTAEIDLFRSPVPDIGQRPPHDVLEPFIAASPNTSLTSLDIRTSGPPDPPALPASPPVPTDASLNLNAPPSPGGASFWGWLKSFFGA